MTAIPTLTTDRLTLRAFRPEDAAQVAHLLATPEIADVTLNVPYPYPEGAAARWIGSHAGAAAARRGYTWAITMGDNVVIGVVGIEIERQHKRGEVGYWLGVPYWGQGIMSEACRCVIDHGFHQLGLHRIEATCLPRNVGSSRVMEKAGMTYEGVLRGYVQKDGRFEDLAMYSIIAEPSDRN